MIIFGIGRFKVQNFYTTNQTIVNLSTSRKGGRNPGPTGGENQETSLEDLLPSGFLRPEPPQSTPLLFPGRYACSAIDARSAAFRRLGEHRIKLATINMPAVSIWIEEKVSARWFCFSPKRDSTRRGQV